MQLSPAERLAALNHELDTCLQSGLTSTLAQGSELQLDAVLQPGAAGEISTESRNAIALRKEPPRKGASYLNGLKLSTATSPEAQREYSNCV